QAVSGWTAPASDTLTRVSLNRNGFLYDVNRRLTQTFADRFFSLLDLSKEKLHALRANSFVFLFGR
ncbi:MAG: hypothetical protein PVI55_18695, partial [Desulfobacterales bacterium]